MATTNAAPVRPPPPYDASTADRHPGVSCDQCGRPIGGGVRYKCALCPAFDLCDPCRAMPDPARWPVPARHTVKHPLLRLDSSVDAPVTLLTTDRTTAVHPSTTCSGCVMAPIVGVRYVYVHNAPSRTAQASATNWINPERCHWLLLCRCMASECQQAQLSLCEACDALSPHAAKLHPVMRLIQPQPMPPSAS